MSQEPLTKTDEDQTFERQLERIEEIVTDLETGTLSLDEMLARYESGMRLIAACQERLASAELKVTTIAEAASPIARSLEQRDPSDNE